MNKFGKFPYLVIPLKELLIQQLNSSENHEHDLNDMISNLHGKLLMQPWAFKLITPYYRSRLHLNENQKQIELELLISLDANRQVGPILPATNRFLPDFAVNSSHNSFAIDAAA